MKFIFALIFVALFTSFSGEDNLTSNLKVRIEGIDKIEGRIGILVFNKSVGFPESGHTAFREMEVEVTSETMEVDLGSLPVGKYAIALIHDRNSNKTLDKNFFGLPKEPFGFSNIDKLTFGPPSFKEASIDLKNKNEVTKIKLLEI